MGSTNQKSYETDLGHNTEIHMQIVHKCSTTQNPIHDRCVVHPYSQRTNWNQKERLSVCRKETNYSTKGRYYHYHWGTTNLPNKCPRCLCLHNPGRTTSRKTVPQSCSLPCHTPTRTSTAQAGQSQHEQKIKEVQSTIK